MKGSPYNCKKCGDSGYVPYFVKGPEINEEPFFYEFGSFCTCQAGEKYKSIFPSVESIERAIKGV